MRLFVQEPLLLKVLPKIRDMCQKKDDLQSVIAWNGTLHLYNQQECTCKNNIAPLINAKMLIVDF